MNQRSRTEQQPAAEAAAINSRILALLGAGLILWNCGAVGAQPGEVYVSPSDPPGPTTFHTIQAGLDAVAPGGVVRVAPGTYMEDLVVNKAVSLLGPNAGKHGSDLNRGPEAVLMPLTDDPANGQIIFLAASNVIIDGFLFNGDNPGLNTGYPVGTGATSAEANTSAAVQNTYFWTTDFVPVDHICIQNNIIRNISYNGIYLELPLGANNGFNYILDNQFETMWEGLQTYAVHSVISNNTFVSVNRGLSVHGTTTAAPPGFTPVIASNSFSIAEWWPTEIARLRTEGIWINYRRENAALLEVCGNVVNTPVPAPAGKTIRGLYALNLAGQGKIRFIGNTVNGGGNCLEGVTVALAPNPGAVSVSGGALSGIAQAGVVATTKDPDWGTNHAFVTVSNVVIGMTGGAGALAFQDPSTPRLNAQVNVVGGCSIHGAAAGVRVSGTNASAFLDGNAGSVTGNDVGLEVDAGKALVQNSNLSGNRLAGVRVLANGIVDAGDCTGGNITGLGSSLGGNDLSGYGLDGTRLAIQNLGTVPVHAYGNNFGAQAGENISQSLSGPVEFSQNPLVASGPNEIVVECVGQIPAVTQDYATFSELGGSASASQINSVSYTDNPANPLPGNGTVIRTWTIVDTCGQNATCEQVVRILDTTPPVIVAPPLVTVDQDAGHCYAAAAHVDLGSPVAADNCGVAGISNDAPEQFPIGLTTVTWTARDINGLTASATQSVTVRDTVAPVIAPPAEIFRGVDAGQNYATITFNPTASDCGTFTLVANPPSGSHFPLGVTTVDLTATDGSGNTSTSSFTVTVVDRPVVAVVRASPAEGVVLSVSGPVGSDCSVECTEDVRSWTSLRTNTVPFEYIDRSGEPRRFYRAVYRP